MQTDRRVRHGFTLVELLTVIAIIGILAGLTAAGLSQAIHRARMTEMYNRMGNVEDLLYIYYTDHGTFPPAYGYVLSDIRDVIRDCGNDGVPDANDANDGTPRTLPALCLNPETTGIPETDYLPSNQFYLGSYMSEIGQTNNPDLYDPWSESYDTDGDSNITYLEYLPLGDTEPGDEDTLYEDGTLRAQTLDERNLERELLDADQRPFLYFPVNRRQAERIGNEYFALAAAAGITDVRPDDANPAMVNTVLQEQLADFTGTADPTTTSEFPPVKYDGFVLMSVGPNNNIGGMLSELTSMVDLSFYPENYRYHVLAHVLYFMATRDVDQNNKLDFNYDDRRKLSTNERLWELPSEFPKTHPRYVGNLPGPVILVSSD